MSALHLLAAAVFFVSSPAVRAAADLATPEARRQVLANSVVLEPGGTRFRNGSTMPIESVRGFLLTEPPQRCGVGSDVAGPSARIQPGEMGELECKPVPESEAREVLKEVQAWPPDSSRRFIPTVIRFGPRPLVVTRRDARFHESLEEEADRIARAKLAEYERSKQVPPPPVPQPAPQPAPPTRSHEDIERDLLLFELGATFGALALGFAIGVPIGRRASRPKTAASAAAVILAIVVTAIVLFGFSSVLGMGEHLGSAGSGDQTGGWGLILGVLMLFGAGMIALWFWGWSAAGLFIGSLVGAAFRRK